MEKEIIEDTLENAVIDLFKKQNYEYELGFDIHRKKTEIILNKDFKEYLMNRYSSLSLYDDEIELILDNLINVREPSLYLTMKELLSRFNNGFVLNRSKYGLSNQLIEYYDFNNLNNNIFKIVNQYEVEGSKRIRRPDLIVFINGIPVSVFELKDPSNKDVTIFDSYEQLTIRYVRDIDNLMRYSFISVISDDANNKFGSLFSSYDFYFPWKSIDGKSYCNDGHDGLITLINGLFDKHTLLNVLKNYIYFPDNSDNDLMILPKYSQYYGSELLYENIKNHLRPEGDGKGGTYFGATGCGKSFTMLFLAKRLHSSPELHNPTIVMLTDRTDLDDQLSESFENAKNYLNDKNVIKANNRKFLTDVLKEVTSGGVYLMTVQKFDEDVGLISDRNNIICISDEAHRTQVNLDYSLDITEEEIKKHYGFAHYLRNSFPNATYVGFTGTPVDKTISVFGDIVCSYKMKQAKDDGSTVGIEVLPGPSAVRLDEEKIKIIDKYYENKLKEGTNKYEINASIKEMSKVRVIIDNESRLDKVVDHFIYHYEKRVEEGSTVKGKAMFVCYDRKIAYKLYKKIIALRPEWNIKKKTQDDESSLSYEELNKLEPVEMIKLVATSNPNDEEELYELLGDSDYRKKLASLFKDENSNFKIAIVVDMWITGFDCTCLDTMYLDKPVEAHTLIQTISRVNRVFKGKSEGLIVDYIGIESSLKRAFKLYDGDNFGVKDDNVQDTYIFYKDNLTLIDELLIDFNVNEFFNANSLERLTILQKWVEFVQEFDKRENCFMELTIRMKRAFDLSIGDERITEEDIGKTHFYCAIRSFIMKLNKEETPDSARMNKEVKKLVDDAINALENEEEKESKKVDLFSNEFLESIKKMPYKNIKLKMLLDLLKKAIDNYSKTNMLKSIEYSKRMKKIVAEYNDRDHKIDYSNEDILNSFFDSLTKQIEDVLKDMNDDANEFKKLGITFEEKAFYDILKDIRDKYQFQYEDDKLIKISRLIKKEVDEKSSYTDWTSKKDIRDKLKMDIARILHLNGYPPKTINDVYDGIFEQVKNYAKNLK